MALQGFAWGIAVMIALFFKGGDSQPACARPPINSRIIGGQDAPPGRWPWHVTFVASKFGFPFCQGSLITDEWVLTAAQCLTIFPDVVLLVGVTNQPGIIVTRTIANVHCHQNYTFYGGNDICLVKLSAPVNFTDYIRPVCLAAENSTFYDGTSSWVTGLSYNGSYSFQEVNVSVLGNKKCNCVYNFNFPITEDRMCENGSKTTFFQDEGAALVTKKDSIWVQSGIVSVNLLNHGIYTRVSQYQKWITDRVTGMEPGFVTYTSPGIDSELNYTCPPPPNSTQYPYFTSQYPYSTTQHPTTDGSIFGSGETLIPITRVFALSALVLFVHLFVGGAAN
ncbi:tryptase beta-2-like [Gambusia affinis]|uniref:tryptase beta-2-like n=1 Tax=Gambusia affinis TaxID=33528 RepID=UPI001CDC4479|nr:tryptase beta-2-like [Gambusia affinis]